LQRVHGKRTRSSIAGGAIVIEGTRIEEAERAVLITARLDALQRLLRRASTAPAPTTATLLREAREHADHFVESPDPRLAFQRFLASAVSALVADGGADARALREAVDRGAEIAGVTATSVAMWAIGDPALMSLPLDAAIAVHRKLLAALAPVVDLTLWLGDPGEDASGFEPDWDRNEVLATADARRSLGLDVVAAEAGRGVTPVLCWRKPCAAFLWLAEPGREREAVALTTRAASMLGPVFERASLIDDNLQRSTVLLKTTERRLTRLGFDLHDGPLQDVGLLVGGLGSLRDQLAAAGGDHDAAAELLAKIDDLAAVATFLDGEMREIAGSLDAPSALRRPFEETLSATVRMFSSRSEIEPTLEISGDAERLSDSQRIAVQRIVQEALSNVRDHSGATSVDVRVRIGAHRVEASIRDDGAGFEVEPAMARAARNGRMGLVGMVERARLLGGTCTIRSRPGGGTSIEVSIARWVPSAEIATDAEPARAAAR